MKLEFTNATLTLVFPKGTDEKAIVAAIKANMRTGLRVALPAGTELGLVGEGKTPAEHQADDLAKEEAYKAEQKAKKTVKP